MAKQPTSQQSPDAISKLRPKRMEAWKSLSDVILSALLQHHEEALFEYAFWNKELKPIHFPPVEYYQAVYQAIINLRGDQQDFSAPQTIFAALEGAVPEEWIITRWTLYDDLQGKSFKTNLHRLMEFGTRYQDIVNVRKFEESIFGAADRRAAVSDLITALSQNGLEEQADPTVGGIFQRIAAEMEQDPPPRVSTGIEYLDRQLGGFIPGTVVVLGGRFKDRKTTSLRNMILGASRPVTRQQTSASITMASYEVRQDDMGYDLIAMLAVEYLVKNHLYDVTERQPGGSDVRIADTFSGRALQLTRRYWHNWSKEKKAAWEYAMSHQKIIGEGVRVYDRTKNGGRIYDPASLRIKVQKDRDAYGADKPFVLMIDHIQIVGDQAIDLTPRTERYMNELQELASSEQVTIVVLSQLNESTVKTQRSDKNVGNKTRSPGGKGSGALHSACDVFLTTRSGLVDEYKEVHPEWLDVTIELARYAPSHKDMVQRMLIHPASGYILGEVDMD